VQVEAPQFRVVVIDEINQIHFTQQINTALAEIERAGGVLIPPIQLATTSFGDDEVAYTALLLYRAASEEVR